MAKKNGQKPKAPQVQSVQVLGPITMKVEQEGRPVPFRWAFPDGMRGVVGENIVVQHTLEWFTISFFEEMQPVIVGTEKERKKQVDEVKDMEMRCVARVRCSPQKVRQFIAAVQENLAKYDAKMKALHEKAAEALKAKAEEGRRGS